MDSGSGAVAMAMEFVVRAGGVAGRLGVLAGSFHPVTRAHMALAEAALAHVDEVLLVMPREFPHKKYEEVGLAERLEIVEAALKGRSGLSLAVSEGGLFLEIARECRAAYEELEEIWFVCGRDAAERISGWDYEGETGFERQLEEFGLLVADRQGSFEDLGKGVRRLGVEGDWDQLSATEVRRRIRGGEPWLELVPERTGELIERYYGGQRRA